LTDLNQCSQLRLFQEQNEDLCKATRGPHYDADATMAVPELY